MNLYLQGAAILGAEARKEPRPAYFQITDRPSTVATASPFVEAPPLSPPTIIAPVQAPSPFWSRPTWPGSPIRMWQGGLLLGGLALLATAATLWAMSGPQRAQRAAGRFVREVEQNWDANVGAAR